MTECSILGVIKEDFSETQVLIPNTVGGVFVASSTEELAQCDNVNFHVLENGLQLKGNADADTVPSGFIGERIEDYVPSASAVSVSTNNPTNVAEITLSPGIWELSALCCLNGSLNGSSFACAISETSETMGANGLNQAATAALPTSNIESTLCVPSVRIETAEEKTMYLVANAVFLLGSAEAYGRLTAVRVA